MHEWNVVVKMKIMPESIDTDFEGIKEKIKKLHGDIVNVHSMELKPIAFGLKALEVNLLFYDKQGGMDDIQEKIQAIEGVSDAEVIDLNRL